MEQARDAAIRQLKADTLARMDAFIETKSDPMLGSWVQGLPSFVE